MNELRLIQELLQIEVEEAIEVLQLFVDLKNSDDIYFQEMDIIEFCNWANRTLNKVQKEPIIKINVGVEVSYYTGEDASAHCIFNDEGFFDD